MMMMFRDESSARAFPGLDLRLKARLTVGLMICLMGALPLSASAQSTYDLRGPVPEIGTVFKETGQMRMGEAALTMFQNGQPVAQGQFTAQTMLDLSRKVLAVENGDVVAWEITVRTEDDLTQITMAGSTQEVPDNSALDGQVVLYERQGEDWRARLAAGEPTPAQQEDLDAFVDRHNRTDYPAEPIAVGESWPLPSEQMQAMFRLEEVRSFDGQATGTLVAVEAEGTRALIDWRMKAQVVMADEGGNEVEMILELTGRAVRDLIHFIDVESSAAGTFSMKGPAGPMLMQLEGPVSFEYSTSVQ